MLIILPSCELLVGVSSGGKKRKRKAILCLQIFIYVCYSSIITFYLYVPSPSPTGSLGKAITKVPLNRLLSHFLFHVSKISSSIYSSKPTPRHCPGHTNKIVKHTALYSFLLTLLHHYLSSQVSGGSNC